ncbi:MAG: hypothetical protein RLZZ621_2371 [Gemmatimonadota bacterium]
MTGTNTHERALPEALDATLRRARTAYLSETAGALRGHDVPVEATVECGPVIETILTTAQSPDVRLLVMATHGEHGPSSAWLGSVADACVRHACCPVVLVRPDAPPSDWRTSTWQLARVLFALDGSADSEAIVPTCASLLGPDLDAVLLHAVAPLHPLIQAMATTADVARDLNAERERAVRYLEQAMLRAAAIGVRASSCDHPDIDPARAIVHCATGHGVSLIAMVTHARGVVGRVMLGSVADKVVRTATHPVLFIRSRADAAAAGASA